MAQINSGGTGGSGSIPVAWTNKYKQNWDESWKRVDAWWRCEETDRPVVFSSASKEISRHTGSFISPKNAEEAAAFDINIDVKLNNARYYLENNVFTAESVPFAYAGFANLLGLLCVQAGGKLHYDYPHTTWIVEDQNLFDKALPPLSASCNELRFILDFIKRCHKTFGFDIVLGANPMIDPITTLSLMRGQENFLIDLIEREDDVMRWLKRLGEFFRQAVVSFRETRKALGRREDYNWTGAWAPGDMDAIQCDVATMLSTEMFRKFALPEAEYEASFYDYVIWHLDGTDEFRLLDDILAIPNLNAIQYVDEKGRDPLEFSHIWEKILKRKKSILFSVDSKFVLGIAKQFGPRGIAFGLRNAVNEKEMETLINKLEEIQ